MSATGHFPPVEALIRQRESMLLIERVLDWGDGWVSVRVKPQNEVAFCAGDDGVPAWVGLEYMAQAVNVYAGLVEYQPGREPALGFLLGTRRYRSDVAVFANDQVLTVLARQKYLDEDRLALFECELMAGEECLARAELKAIQPEDPAMIFGERQ